MRGKNRRPFRVVAVAVGTALAVTLLALVSIPVTHAFSASGGQFADLVSGCQGKHVSIPAGAYVTFTWRAIYPFAQHLSVWSCSVAHPVGYYSGYGLNGSGNFSSQGGLVAFGVGLPLESLSHPSSEYGANVSGTYRVPLL